MEDKSYEELMAALASVRSKTDFVPEIGLTLGSGLGSLAESMEVECRIDYREIAGFPVSTVAGHDGSFLFGKIAGRRVAAMNGRVHYYEGYPMQKVVMPVRLMRLLGAQAVLLTNAAGGINQTFRPGDLMLITDHISQFVPDPLIGPNTEELGSRFTDMTCVYDRELRETVLLVVKRRSPEPARQILEHAGAVVLHAVDVLGTELGIGRLLQNPQIGVDEGRQALFSAESVVKRDRKSVV